MKYLFYIAFVLLQICNLYAEDNLKDKLMSQHIDSIYSYCNNSCVENIYINKLSFPKSYEFDGKYTPLLINTNDGKILKKKTLSINWKGFDIKEDGTISFQYGIWRYSGKSRKIYVEFGYLDFCFSYKFNEEEKKWHLVSVNISGI